MKKTKKLLSYAITSLLIIGTVSFLFTGCGGKSAAASTNKSLAGNKTGNGPMNSDAMKKKMEDSISSLVTAGTITKDQESKIVDALTSGTRNFGGNRSSQGSQNGAQNNTGNNGNASATNNGNATTNNTGNSNTANNGQGRRGNGQFANPLSKLVADKTITQAQSDAVMAKIRTNYKHTGANGNNFNNGNSNSNSNGN